MQQMQIDHTHQKNSGGIVPALNALLRKPAAQSATGGVNRRLKLTAGVISAKGGSGATTLAVNLAASLAAAGHEACLVDAHFQNPDATVIVGRNPIYSIVELLTRRNDLNESLFKSCAVPLCEGTAAACLFVSGPADGSAGLSTSLSELAMCVPEFKEYSGMCVVDLPNHLDKHLVNLMDVMDVLVLVFEPTVNGVAAVKRWLSVFSELGYSKEKVVLVQNRSGSKLKVDDNDIRRILARGVDFAIPNKFTVIEQAILAGQPAVLTNPNDQYSLALKRIAEAFVHVAHRQPSEGVE